MRPDPNATGAPTPLPATAPGTAGREEHERAAAFARGKTDVADPRTLTAPERVLRLPAHRVFTILADKVRDYAIFLMDPDGIIAYWGDGARIMKWWTKQQAEGSHLRLLYMDGGSEDGTAEAHLQVAAELGEYTGEGRRVRNDGSTFWGGITMTALKDEDGTLLGFAKVTRDFTARRAVEDALKTGQAAIEGQRLAEEANRLKNLFVASVSHEIRGPLNAMLGNVQLLERESYGRPRQQAHIARIQSSGTHLRRVVEDLLDMSRLEANRLALNQAAAHIGAAVQAALGDVEAGAAEKGITLSNAVSGAAAELPYWGDETRVRQILVNLLSNAIKFTPAQGRVTVSGGTAATAPHAGESQTGAWVYVRVEDTGVGIPAERLTAIFEPFEQARPTDSHQGAGLGLAISRRLARLMGGDLTVRSDIGVGSEFALWLPIAASGDVPR